MVQDTGVCCIALTASKRCWYLGAGISLADARARRDEARKLLANGIDPGDKKKNDKVERSKTRTLNEVAIE
jgi:hypothetical protein